MKIVIVKCHFDQREKSERINLTDFSVEDSFEMTLDMGIGGKDLLTP